MIDRRTFLGSVAALGVLAAVKPRALSAFGPPIAGPAEVLIMRHGEEPVHGPHLDDNGRARAAALIKLFPARFVVPTALFATHTSKESARPMETLAPLAAALHLSVDDTFTDPQYRRLADAVLTRPALAGGHVLICWHHGMIPFLAAALGVVRPPAWPGKQYDHVWRITYAAGRATLTDEHELLLPGDREPESSSDHQQTSPFSF